MTYTESEIRDEVLVELSHSKRGILTISQLIERLESRLVLCGLDAEILDGRGDTHFSQKVRNTVSHRNQGTGLSARGLAVYSSNNESWEITSKGRKYIASI